MELNQMTKSDSVNQLKPTTNIVQANHYGLSPDFPLEMLITVTLEDHEGKTRLTMKYSSIDGVNNTDRGNMQHGWNESLDKLVDNIQHCNKG